MRIELAAYNARPRVCYGSMLKDKLSALRAVVETNRQERVNPFRCLETVTLVDTPKEPMSQ
jgi:hypothetical protein